MCAATHWLALSGTAMLNDMKHLFVVGAMPCDEGVCNTPLHNAVRCRATRAYAIRPYTTRYDAVCDACDGRRRDAMPFDEGVCDTPLHNAVRCCAMRYRPMRAVHEPPLHNVMRCRPMRCNAVRCGRGVVRRGAWRRGVSHTPAMRCNAARRGRRLMHAMASGFGAGFSIWHFPGKAAIMQPGSCPEYLCGALV
jgi:hypothetical protein